MTGIEMCGLTTGTGARLAAGFMIDSMAKYEFRFPLTVLPNNVKGGEK